MPRTTLLLAALALFNLPGILTAQDEEKLPAIVSAKPLPADPKDDELRKLLKERYNAALEELNATYQQFMAGRGTIDSMFQVAERVLKSRMDLVDKAADKIPFLTQLVEFARTVEETEKARFEAGRVPIQDLQRARYQRLDMEIQLLRAKRAAEKK